MKSLAEIEREKKNKRLIRKIIKADNSISIDEEYEMMELNRKNAGESLPLGLWFEGYREPIEIQNKHKESEENE